MNNCFNYTRPCNRRRAVAGFNLVELSLAVAVVAVGVVSVFGILPHLIKSSRQALEYSAITVRVQNVMDDPGHRGLITFTNMMDSAVFPTITAPAVTTIYEPGFEAVQSISSWNATNADYSIVGNTNYYKSTGGKPLLKTVFITYRWGQTNSAANVQSYTFITETAVTEQVLTP